MRILVDNTEISILKKDLEKRINNISGLVEQMEIIKNDLIWQGKSYETFVKKYDNNIKNIKNKMNNVYKCVNFLDEFNNGYGQTQEGFKSIYSKQKGVL